MSLDTFFRLALGQPVISTALDVIAVPEAEMFNDKIDYSHPEILPYSDGSTSELVFSWIIGAVFIAGLLLAIFA